LYSVTNKQVESFINWLFSFVDSYALWRTAVDLPPNH
jgi:hypothetical protein